MLRVGNDVVDIIAPENRDKNKNRRFCNKVFSSAEQDFIGNSPMANAVLWALWAGKEAAYKALSKLNPLASSAPLLYNVKPTVSSGLACVGGWRMVPVFGEKSMVGIVESQGESISFRTIITPNYVHCLATLGNSPFSAVPLVSNVIRIENAADISQTLRREIILRAASVLRITPASIEIERPPTPLGLGAPRLVVEGRQMDNIDISMSHDGNYGAYAIAMMGRQLRRP